MRSLSLSLFSLFVSLAGKAVRCYCSAAWVRFLGLDAVGLASLNNVISESVALYVCDIAVAAGVRCHS